ncbi:hypothetical protein CGT94_01995 [Vibrio metoecus]|uniref:hypothetical protein n=1 Tax=Vibrio metoecus TaxID=1481663 RepID=UPI0006D8570C|nr:hypothetical protein [Vibrio metoecus]KQA20496.1 lipoprotein [Vibrio metoecus]KQB06163.1 lipoprotein [Vibrio metoecus]PAR51586.1 hypothetical protein CGT94_01995 [Vibrio metoecus]WKY94791.1 hypothetical protein QYQ96_18380 [Vibrio metoecus]
MNWVKLQRVFLMVSVVLLGGCFQEKLENFVNRETLAFNGLFDNPHNQDILEFRQGVVYIHSAQQKWERPFSVEGNTLRIQIRNNSKEKRDDLLMTIHGGGEVLTCNACAMVHLSNNWVKVNAEPQSTQSSETK